MQSFRTSTERSIKKDIVTAEDPERNEDLNNFILCQMTRIMARIDKQTKVRFWMSPKFKYP